MAKQEVAAENTAVANIGAFDTGSTGYENVTSNDLLIPRLTILQALSPQLVKSKPEYDSSASAGDIYDVGLQEVFGGSLSIVPVYYKKQWLKWAPRNSGRGLIEIFDSESEAMKGCQKDERNRPVDNEGNYVQETAQIYCLNMSADGRRSFIPMSSTQLKKARRLLTLATGEKLKRSDGTSFTPPLWYRSYDLTTVEESNSEGSWHGWKIERGKSLPEFDNTDSLLEEIRDFRDSLVKGESKGDLASMAEEGSSGHDPDGAM
jgi:hypothetical protein